MPRETRVFHLGDVLSLTTSYLVSPRSLEGLYELIFYLTNEEPSVDVLEGVVAACRGYLVSHHSALELVDTEGIDADNWRKWLDQQVRELGQWVDVEKPLPGELR